MGDPSTTSPVDVDEEFGGALGLTSPPKLNPGLPTVQVDPDLLNDDLYGDLVDERGTGGTLLGLQLAQVGDWIDLIRPWCPLSEGCPPMRPFGQPAQ